MIRACQAADLEEVMDIWLSGNRDAHNFIPASFWEEHFDEVADAIAAAEVYVFDDHGIKGFIGLEGGYIAGLFVRGDERGKGIGAALLEFVCGREVSAHVFLKNERALQFYLKNGFSVVGERVSEETGEVEVLVERKIIYSTVTLFAKLRGMSTSVPKDTAVS